MATAILIILLVLGAGGLIAGYYGMIAPVGGPETELIQVEVPSGASTALIGEILAEAGVIRNPLIFRLYARLNGLEQGFIAGEYRLNPAMDLGEIAAVISSGAVHRETEWFTVPEGFTVRTDRRTPGRARFGRSVAIFAIGPKSSERITSEFPLLSCPMIRDHLCAGRVSFPDTYEIAAEGFPEEIITLMPAGWKTFLTKKGAINAAPWA